ncbi:MAG: ribokinase [Bacillota bacterium]
MSIVVVGSLNMDHIMQVEELPRRGETVFSRRYSTAPGGKGANQAAAAARLGADVKMVGCVGDDLSGKALVGNLQAFGVDTFAVRADASEPTGSAFITVSASGANTIVVHRGANFALSPQHCRDYEQLIAQASVLVAQLETPVASVMEAFQIARRHRVITILNPAPAAPVPRQLLEMADYLVPNETEMASLEAVIEDAGMSGGVRAPGGEASRDLSNPQEAVKVAAKLARATSSTVIVTLGENGCVCAVRGGRCGPAGGPPYTLGASPIAEGAGDDESAGGGWSFALPAFRVKAIDTTAAGDTFVGALAYKLDKGSATGQFNLEAALQFASAAGALATTKVGAQPSLPTLADMVDFLESRSATLARADLEQPVRFE